MVGFSAYYSLIFFAETVILAAISNYWQKYPKSANAVARCEHVVSEYNKGEFLITASGKDLAKRLELLLDCYNQQTKKKVSNKATVLRPLLRPVLSSLLERCVGAV